MPEEDGGDGGDDEEAAVAADAARAAGRSLLAMVLHQLAAGAAQEGLVGEFHTQNGCLTNEL